MRLRVAFLALLVGLASVAVSPAAEIDCSNIEPSTGLVPKELAEVCGSGSQGGAPVGTDFPADLAFGPEMVNLNLVNLVLGAPEVLNAVGPVTAPEFIGGCDFAYDFDVLFCADTLHTFFMINTATGARADIGPLNPPPPGAETVTGLAFDAIGGMMYICTTDLVTSSLMRVLPSGATSPVGTITNSPGIIACAVDPTGNLWGYDMMTDMLLSIDKYTGAGTEIGPIGFDAAYGQGMDFDDSDGTCYMFAFNNGAGQAELRTCDTTSGASTFIGVLGETTPGGLTQVSGAGIATLPWTLTPNMFAIDELSNGFYGIDPNSGGAFLIGDPGEDFSASGLAWDSWNKVMYVSDVTMPGLGWGLGKIDIYTGRATVIGPHVTTNNIYGLGFDSINNVLYGANTEGSCLVSIDRSTGEASPCIGSFVNAGPLGGLAFNNHTDTLYGIDDADLFTLDRGTGLATVVGPHGITAPTGAFMGLEYDSETGVLYAGAGDDPLLYAVDPTTGAASPIGPHGIAQLGGLASTMAPGEPCDIFCDGFESGDTTQWN